MKNTLLISTRKGQIVCSRRASGWKITDAHFEGIPVSLTYEDEVNGVCGPVH